MGRVGRVGGIIYAPIVENGRPFDNVGHTNNNNNVCTEMKITYVTTFFSEMSQTEQVAEDVPPCLQDETPAGGNACCWYLHQPSIQLLQYGT